jgi:hypothetical protein
VSGSTEISEWGRLGSVSGLTEIRAQFENMAGPPLSPIILISVIGEQFDHGVDYGDSESVEIGRLPHVRKLPDT